MTLNWAPVPFPNFQNGEDTGSAPLATALANRIENGILTGNGVVEQVPDWRLGATCTDGAVENDAVCGIFPFATQGTASAPSAGLAFSFDASADKIWLHQLGEDGSILRTLQAYAGYVETAPPQMTGFEMFGKFYVVPYGREAAANRLGMGVYDPSANTFTVPTYDLSAGGAAAARLRFRGIAKHRGATILGWGYFNEEAGNIDQPQTVRYCKYGTPDTWVNDGTPTTASFFNVGTLNLPVIAMAASGQYTVMGKETEIFVLDGDYSEQFYYRQIGNAHGPCSTVGMCSTGPLAVWLDREGYIGASENGGAIQLIATDRITRRRLSYFDRAVNCTAVHDSARTRVGWLLRRMNDLDGNPLTANWPDQIFWWDYERDAIHIQGTPTTCYVVGTIAGPGVTFAAPAGTPSSLLAVATSSSVAFTWSNSGGDPSAQTSVEYRVNGAPTYIVAGLTAVGAVTFGVAGLAASTTFNWRLRYFKNGQYGSYVAGSNFTTAAASSVGTPTALTWASDRTYLYGGKTYVIDTLTWVAHEFSAGASTDVLTATIGAAYATASVVANVATSVTSADLQALQGTTGLDVYVRHRLADGTIGNAAGPVTIDFLGLA